MFGRFVEFANHRFAVPAIIVLLLPVLCISPMMWSEIPKPVLAYIGTQLHRLNQEFRCTKCPPVLPEGTHSAFDNAPEFLQSIVDLRIFATQYQTINIQQSRGRIRAKFVKRWFRSEYFMTFLICLLVTAVGGLLKLNANLTVENNVYRVALHQHTVRNRATIPASHLTPSSYSQKTRHIL